MRLTKRLVQEGLAIYYESKWSRYCVRVAARLTPTGREQKKRFPLSRFGGDGRSAYEAAKAWAESRRGAVQQGGKLAFALTPLLQQQAAQALQNLAEAGVHVFGLTF